MKEKAVGYIRVSTQGQARDGYSLSYQEEEIQRFCARHQIDLIGIYKDEGVSGAKVDEDDLTIEREGLQSMLIDLQRQDIKYVVVLNTSRLWRADIVKVLIQRELKRHQIDVKSIEQPSYSIYNHDPSDFLINGMMELLDQYQRLEIALKLGKGRKKEGGYSGGRAAYGYSSHKGQKVLTVNVKQADAVRSLFKLRQEYPTWSLTQIAQQLNLDGHLTSTGKPFSKVQVKRIIDREEFYKGIYHYGDIVAEGKHQTIL